MIKHLTYDDVKVRFTKGVGIEIVDRSGNHHVIGCGEDFRSAKANALINVKSVLKKIQDLNYDIKSEMEG
jgi:hypothetical protein